MWKLWNEISSFRSSQASLSNGNNLKSSSSKLCTAATYTHIQLKRSLIQLHTVLIFTDALLLYWYKNLDRSNWRNKWDTWESHNLAVQTIWNWHTRHTHTPYMLMPHLVLSIWKCLFIKSGSTCSHLFWPNQERGALSGHSHSKSKKSEILRASFRIQCHVKSVESDIHVWFKVTTINTRQIDYLRLEAVWV